MSARLQRASIAQLRTALGSLADGPPHSARRVCLVVDADRTLAPQDTGRVAGRRLGVDAPIRNTFETHGYSERAFAEVADIWGTVPIERYVAAARAASAEVAVRGAWHSILRGVRESACTVVVTAGIPQVWRRVLDSLDYPIVPVIGGCHRDVDPYVVCPETKRDIVGILQTAGWTVVAAGDGPIDAEMLACADRAIFVPDHKGSPGLRKHVHRIAGLRHLLVDAQRFEEIPPCTPEQVIEMVRRGGCWDAA